MGRYQTYLSWDPAAYILNPNVHLASLNLTFSLPVHSGELTLSSLICVLRYRMVQRGQNMMFLCQKSTFLKTQSGSKFNWCTQTLFKPLECFCLEFRISQVNAIVRHLSHNRIWQQINACYNERRTTSLEGSPTLSTPSNSQWVARPARNVISGQRGSFSSGPETLELLRNVRRGLTHFIFYMD